MKEFDSQIFLNLINEVIGKVESASIDYRNAVYPIQVEILNEQIRQLQVHSRNEESASMVKYFKMVFELQRRLCYYIDAIPEMLTRIF